MTNQLEQTFVMVKPDGVARGLTGEIIKRFEQRGLKIIALKLVRVSMDHAKQHYTEDITKRRGEYVRNKLLNFLTEGPVVAIVIEGVQAIENVRKIVGSTESKTALPGTIRGDYSHMSYEHADGKNIALKNIIHASSDKEDAQREIALWFSVDEIFDYKRADEEHVF